MTIIITLIAFILLILVMVWTHYLTQVKQNDVDRDIRERTNRNLYHEHKAEIEADFERKKIDEENYQYLLAELDKSFMQDMEENQTQFIAGDLSQKLSVIWPIAISAFILIFSIFLYQKTGAFDRLSLPKVTAKTEQNDANITQQSSLARIEELKVQLTQSPKNSQLWYALGQELIGVGAFDGALAAFDKTIEIEGVVADLIGAKAQATYYKNKQQITPEVTKLIEQALALDAEDASTNILLGMHAFGLASYEEAIQHWELVIKAKKPVNVAALTNAINEAKQRLGLTVINDPLTDDTSTNGISVNVSMSTDIRNQLIEGSDKAVFVYAIPSNGPRIPVAAVKVSASDLPINVVLNDSNAMNPERKISLFDEVSVFAVVSQKGSPGIKPGDFLGQLDSVNVKNNNGIVIVIDTITE